MVKVVSVRFRTAGKIYFFGAEDKEINKGDHVIVETARGVEYGTAVSGVREIPEEKIVQPLKNVIRVATKEDDEQQVKNGEKEKDALALCRRKIAAHGLVMKLIDAEYTFDGNKLLFYFTADGRVDFRELVKDLAGTFRTRIELRQIGVRDETKLIGGIGVCGRELCCKTFLPDFGQVSIKMAKDQGLSLNQQKISGLCGRLMCCIKNEAETYEELNKHMPSPGDTVTTPEGDKGVVHSISILKQNVRVIIDEGDEKEIKEYPVSELTFKRGHHKDRNLSAEELAELKELEELEKKDQMDKLESDESKPVKNEMRRPDHKGGRNEKSGEEFGKGHEKNPSKNYDKKNFDKNHENRKYDKRGNRDGKHKKDSKKDGQ